MLELRRLAEVDLDDVIAQDERSFALNYDVASRLAVTEDLQAMASGWAVIDAGDVVGFAGARNQQLTVSTGKAVSMLGLTWVSVAPSHRRRGLAARLIEAVHVDAADQAVVCLGLVASEGGIYSRFGYGPATFLRQLEIDRRSARFRPGPAPRGRVRYLSLPEALRQGPPLYERYRLSQRGAVSRTEAQWTLAGHRHRNAYWVAHEDETGRLDGLAGYTIEHRFDGSRPAYVLTVHDVFTVTADARRALLTVLLTTDLVATVTTSHLPLDDPLVWELEDRRAVTATAERDQLWLAPLDIPTLLAARARVDTASSSVVIEVAGAGRWVVEAAADDSSVEPTTKPADLTLGRSEFGSIVLGGTVPSMLVLAGRAAAPSAASLARVDALFRVDRLPFCNTMF